VDISPAVTDEAAYLSENFGIPLAIALELTLAKAEKATRKKKRAGR
jgi:hypothetical protein